MLTLTEIFISCPEFHSNVNYINYNSANLKILLSPFHHAIGSHCCNSLLNSYKGKSKLI